MKRADFITLRPVALAVCLLAQLAQAQTAAPAGLPTDVTHTATLPAGAALHPQAPGSDAQPGAVFHGERGGLDYRANAAVGRVLVEVERDAVPADGQTPVRLTLRLFDRTGQPLASPAFATLEHSGGRLLLPGARTDEFGPRRLDADRSTPGVQIKVEQGVAEFTLLAPAEAQDVRVRVSAGDQEASGTIRFVPELRPMIAAGLIEGVVSFRNRVALTPARQGDGFEREIQSWAREFNGGKANAAARVAFYLKGTIRGDWLLTAAYDSDKETRARLLRDVQPDAFYPVYGDASLRSFDARSGDRLYVRIDKNRSYVLYGDFVTGDGFSQPMGQGAVAALRQRSLGNYNRSATGIRAHHDSGRFTGNLFVFNDALRQVVEEFASQGSGPYALRNNAVLEGSEKIEVVVRDRNQPARIISVRPLARLIDYSFEPFSGRILLASFLPSFDADLNPVSLRVSYEVDQGGQAFWVAGADAQYRLTQQLELGGSLVRDRNPLAPYELVSANATWRLGERSAVVLELAQSTSSVNTNPVNRSTSPGLASRVGEVQGQAARIEWVHVGERTEARVFIGQSDPAFNNPAAPLSGGRSERYARGSYALSDDLKLYAEGLDSQDRNPGGGERSGVAAGMNLKLSERLTLDASLRRDSETVGSQGSGFLISPFGLTDGLSGSLASGSSGSALGLGAQVLDPASGLPVIEQRALTPGSSTLPAGTELQSDTVRLGLGYRVSDRLRLGAQVQTSVAGDQRRRLALGADYQIAERTRVYGRYERQSGWVQLGGVTGTGQNSNQFVFGAESTYLRDTQLFSEYRLRDAISGRDLQLASGLRHFWDLREGLRMNAAVEHVQVLSGQVAQATAYSVGLDYSASPLWRGSTRLEHRRSGDIDATPANDAFNTSLWQVMAARKLDRDWTLLGRNHLLMTDHSARGDVLQNRAQLGVAYRQTDTNRVNALAKIEYKFERDASNAAVGEVGSRAWIVSAHADWHPSRSWWMTGRVAGKWQADRFENGVRDRFHAQLVSARVVYDITEKWDLGLLAAAHFGQRGARQQALGAEVGYLLQQNLWLSAGFNATGFYGDADLAGYEYTQQGFYLRLRFKFDETLFQSGNPKLNRSLTP